MPRLRSPPDLTPPPAEPALRSPPYPGVNQKLTRRIAAKPPPPAGLRPSTSTPSTPTTARARFLLPYPGVNHQPTNPSSPLLPLREIPPVPVTRLTPPHTLPPSPYPGVNQKPDHLPLLRLHPAPCRLPPTRRSPYPAGRPNAAKPPTPCSTASWPATVHPPLR